MIDRKLLEYRYHDRSYLDGRFFSLVRKILWYHFPYDRSIENFLSIVQYDVALLLELPIPYDRSIQNRLSIDRSIENCLSIEILTVVLELIIIPTLEFVSVDVVLKYG